MSILEPSTIERYEDMPSATSTAGGAVAIGLQQVPVGTRCVFTVSVPGSPPLASWSIAKGSTGAAQTLMTWAGPTPVGPFTIDGPERLIVTGTNTQPLVPIQAIALGKRGPVVLIEPEVPTGPAQFTVPTGGPPTILGTFAYSGPGPTGFPIGNLPLGLRSVTLALTNLPGLIQPTSMLVNGLSGVEYFQGEMPGSTANGLLSSTFSVNPNEQQLTFTMSGGGSGMNFVVLGSFTDRAFTLQPPAGMPPSASQLTSQSAVAPGLDRSLWTARADVPRFAISAAFSANGTLIPAPGAGLRLKLYSCTASNTPAVCTAGINGLIGSVSRRFFTFNGSAAPTTTAKDLGGIELDANVGLSVAWAAGTVTFDQLYDIVPA